MGKISINPEEIFYNEFLPENKILGYYLKTEEDILIANFSKFVEENYPKLWDIKLEKTIYKEIIKKYLNKHGN